MKKSTKAQTGVVVMMVLIVMLLLVAMVGCVSGQERNNPCDPAVGTQTPEG